MSVRDKALNRCAKQILKHWFVVTPKSKEEPKGDVWGMDTSLGGIDEVKEDIEQTLKSYFDLAVSETRKELLCATCGFPKDIKRNSIFLKSNIYSFMMAEENICSECCHQKDGSTIPVVADFVRP